MVAIVTAGLITWTGRVQAEGTGRKAVEKIQAVYPLIAKTNRIREDESHSGCGEAGSGRWGKWER